MERLIAVLGSRHDALRGVGRYEVVDNGQWSATGESFIAIRVDGQRRVAIYRDGPRPDVGSHVQAFAMGPGPTARMLALPIAPEAPTLECEYDFFFRANGRLINPPPYNQLPQDGSLFGKIVSATLTFSPDCRNVYYGIRSYAQITPGGSETDLYLFDEDVEGPRNPPTPGQGWQDIVTIDVQSYPQTYFYYVEFFVSSVPVARLWPPLP